MSEVTRLLSAIENGDPLALEELLPHVYDALRGIAARSLARERPGHSLQPTALVHEAYLRLVDEEAPRYRDRGHFFSAAAVAMRRILVESARRRASLKRGGGRARVTLADVAAPEPDAELLALDQALARLALIDPEKVRLVELRYFGGLSGDQAAAVLGISPSTADRHWTYARAWLQGEVRGPGDS